MPELPEVHGYQVYIDSTSLNQKIVNIECRDKRLLKTSLHRFQEYLLGESFTETVRIGKYLFLKTSGPKILLMHFGMTGRPNYYKDPDERPKFGHIVISFENGFHLAFENKRKFGWWQLVDDVEEYRRDHNLSKDARELTEEEFKESIATRKTHIKKILMDQSVAAGVGNWMADEILYQSQIHPKHKVEDLTKAQIKKIYNSMQHVIETAIEHDAHYADFPEEFLIHNRKEGATCYHTGAEIEKIKVGGRSTYFSPEWQKLKN